MSFNKGFISEDKIKETYLFQGIEGVKSLLNSYDAFYGQDEYTSKVIEYFNKGKLEELFK